MGNMGGFREGPTGASVPVTLSFKLDPPVDPLRTKSLIIK